MKGFYKNLAIASIIALVIMQGFVFVTTRAAFGSDLQALFVEPSQQINIGDKIEMQAMLSADTEQAFDNVFFTVKNIEHNIDLNFTAYLQADGVWLADSVWDTANYYPGAYQLSAVAKIYGDDGLIVEDFHSPEYELYLTGDVPKEEVIKEEAVNEAEVKGEKIIDEEVIEEPEIKEVAEVAEEEIIETPEKIIEVPEEVVGQVEKELITLIRPVDKDIINKYNFQVFVQTNVPTSNLSVEFFNAEDAAISTGQINIPNFNNTHWITTLHLDEGIFIDGRYKLVVTATSDVTTTEFFDFILQIGS